MRAAKLDRKWAASRGWLIGVSALGIGVMAAGCAHVPNQFKETGPATTERLLTPSAAAILEGYASAGAGTRGWEPLRYSAMDGTVTHWPLYFEDPFEDKGHGRTDETHPKNVYRLGWEDYVAMPYGLARYTLNWLFLPVSAVVTPPWTLMESDGVLSRQMLGYDHDAIPASRGGDVEDETPSEGDTAEELIPSDVDGDGEEEGSGDVA